MALKGDIGDRFLAGSLGFSAGVMIYISLVELLPESMEALDNDWSAIAAFFFGVALIAVIDRLVPDDINPHEPSTSTATQATTLRRAGLMTGIAIQTGHHHVSVYWMMGGMGLMAASLLMLA